MRISPEEVKKVRKMLLLNLLVADLVLLLGLWVNWQGGHKWQTLAFLLVIPGAIWVLMTISKMIKFRRFLRATKTEGLSNGTKGHE